MPIETADNAVKGLAVLTAIPVVLFALWSDYFGRFIQERLKETPKMEIGPELTRVRLAGFFAFLSQFMLFVGTSEARRENPIFCNLLFIAALIAQMGIQASTEKKIAPLPKPNTERGAHPFSHAMRTFIWSTLGGLLYVGLLVLALQGAAWASSALHLTPNMSAAVIAAGAAAGVLGGLGLGFALGPFQMRRMFPTQPLSDEELSRELQTCFERNGLRPPSLWVIGTSDLHFANAMIAGFRSGRGIFRPALFLSKGLVEGLDRAELRAVVLHEISHLRLNHLRKRFVFSSGMIMATSLVAGFTILAVNLLIPGGQLSGAVGFATLSAAFILTFRALARQNRFHEIEADICSVKLGAGIEELASALRKLDRINLKSHSTSGRIGSHPLTEERIRILKAYFERHPLKVAPQQPDPERKEAA